MPIAGRPMLEWSIAALQRAGVGQIVVALPAAWLPAGADVIVGDAGGTPVGPDLGAAPAGVDPGLARVGGDPSGPSVGGDPGGPSVGGGLGGWVLPAGCVAVPGGAERSHSARAALAASGGDPVLVHDAARPLLTPELVAAAVGALETDPDLAAAIVAAPVTDTIKRSADGLYVSETLVRSELWAVQTPQVFRRAWLERALALPDDVLAQATDDASIVESLGGKVGLVPATGPNMKVTTPHDLTVAELLLGA